MKAGDLRDYVTIEQKILTQADSGEEIVTWEPFHGCYASIEPISGREYFVAQQVVNVATIRIRIRYYPGVVPQMRVVHGSEIYNIIDVQDLLNKHTQLHLMCTIGANDG